MKRVLMREKLREEVQQREKVLSRDFASRHGEDGRRRLLLLSTAFKEDGI